MTRTVRLFLVGMMAIWLALSISVIDQPAYAKPVPLETSLAERSNPAVNIVTTQYDARVSLKTIGFSRDGLGLIRLAAFRRQQGQLRTQASFINYVFDRVQRDPTRYLAATGRNRTLQLSSQWVGSSFVATADGYLVTAAHVVSSEQEARQTFAESGAATIAEADTRALLKEFAEFDLSTGAMRKISRSMQIFARAKVKVKLSDPKVSVRLGVASSSGQRVPQNHAAEVVKVSDPALGEDVAVLRIRVSGLMPTLDLGTDPPLQGSVVYINAFPAAATYVKDFSKAAKLQPTISKGTIGDIKSTDGGLSLYQTDANASPGSSGGAAFDEHGKVVGILTSGAIDQSGNSVGQNYLMPLDSVRTMLTRAGAKPELSQTSVLWEQGLSDFHNEYYSKALGEFQQVRDLYPAHAYVGRYITDAQTAINKGEDKIPPPPAGAGKAPSWQLPAMIAAGVAVLVVVALVTGLLIRRRSRAALLARAGGPAPVPAPPYAYAGQPGNPGPGVGYGGPVQATPPQSNQSAWYPTWYGGPDSYANSPGSQEAPPTQSGPPSWPPAPGQPYA